MSALATRLAERTLELVNIPSESRHEAEIAAHVRSLVPASFAPEYEADDAFVWASPRRDGRPLVVLAGHYDTVPPQENVPGRIEDGSVVGLGASDMKGGLAVMLELARALDAETVEPEVDLALLAFGKEELPAEYSPLPALFDTSRVVHEAGLAILLEPTDCTIQAGCLGNMNARITFHGVSGHSARPWTAENAIDKALDGLRPYAGIEPRPVEIGGLTFTEVASVTQIEGGIATNVIPDRVEANVNFRYAPDRSPAERGRLPPQPGPRGSELRAHGRLSAGTRRHRLAAGAAPSRRRRSGARAEAGVDERRRLHDTGHRRRQLRPRRDPVCAPARRTSRDRVARAGVHDALAVRHGYGLSVPVSPILERQTTYPFVRLAEAAARVRERGIEVIDFGTGDPREPTDPRIRQALVDGLRDRMGYPAAVGLPELREAVAAWAARRFGTSLDPDTEVIPTLGSKEAIFTFALAVVDADGTRDTVAYTDPGYPVYERGALFAHARPLALPLHESNGFLPDLDAVDEETWSRLAVFWVNYPNNPTAATAPLSFYEQLAALAREHGFVIASDEAYTELWFEEPPASALQLLDRTNVVVFNTLSKRSSMTGYRSGFAAGDPALIGALKAFRPTVGTAPQEFVQRASVVAWGDEEHVEETRARYGRKRALFLDLFDRKGIRVPGREATMYLWAAVPNGESSEAFAERLLEHGVLITPGSFLGAAGEGYIRVALVPSEEECVRAVEILEHAL